MANFEEIDDARRLLQLGEAATLKEIKQAYRKLAFRHHPDSSGGGKCSEDQEMKRLNWAYKLLTEYCICYSYTFREEDVGRAYPHDEYLRKYRKRYYGWFEGSL